MNILKELYNGNIAEGMRSHRHMSKAKEKEGTLYEKIKEALPVKDSNLIDEFIDAMFEVYDEEFEDKYIQGLKTGLLIGIEVCNLEL